MGPNNFSLIIITGEEDTSRAPNSLFRRSAADTLTALRTSPDATAKVHANPLDEQQQQIVASEERAKCRSETLVYLAK